MNIIEDHPLAAIFPLMGDEDLKALADDIEANGLRDPIWKFEGKVLDGRNRYRACQLRDVDPRFEEYKGRDAIGFVISKNLHRRHLTESQRAMVAERIANAKNGGDRSSSPIGEVPREKAADMLNVSPRSVDRAREVRTKGTPALAAAVESGTVSLNAASEVAKLPSHEQQTIVAAGPAVVREKANELRAERKSPPAQSKPHLKPPEPPEPQPEVAWSAVAEQLAAVAKLIESAPTPSKEVKPWELVESLESTARVMVEKAREIRRRFHL